MGQTLLTILTVFLLYIRRFSKDFDEDQVSIFVVACILVIIAAMLLVWLTNRGGA